MTTVTGPSGTQYRKVDGVMCVLTNKSAYQPKYEWHPIFKAVAIEDVLTVAKMMQEDAK